VRYGLIYGLLLCVGLLPVFAEEALELSLRAAQERAERDNALLRAAAEKVTQARASALESWAGYWPNVRVSERVVRSDDAVNAFGFRLKQERFRQSDFALERLNAPAALNNFQTQIEVQQPIYSGGRALNGRRRAVAFQHAEEAGFVRRGAEVREQTAVAYWDLVLAGSALVAVEQNLKAARADAHIVDLRYTEGAALGTERLAAQLRALEAEVEQGAAVAAQASAQERLSLLLGLEATVQIKPTQELAVDQEIPTLASLIDRAWVERADLRAASYELQAAERGVGVAKAAHWPQLGAFARAGLDADALLERQGESWTVGAELVWELPAASSVGQVRRARAQREQARAQLEFLRAQIERDVRGGYRSVHVAQVRLAARVRAVELALERRRIAQLHYGELMTTTTELLAARTVLAQARLGRIQAQRDVRVRLAQLELAIGGALEKETGEQH
jgi:outer membrane protein